MTISSTGNRTSANGNGVTTLFSFPYRFLADADLVVIQKVTATGVETVKTLTTHYTVSGAGGSSGGSVTMLVAPPTGTELIIYRDPALTQGLDLVENDALPAESVETAFDRLTMITQRLKEVDQRTIRLPEGYTASFDAYLPALIEADAVLKFNSDGDGFEIGPTTTEIEEAEENAAAATASASAASASASAAAASEAAAAVSAAAAQNAVDSVLWNDVRYITSNTVIPDDAAGVLYVVDATGGNVSLTLPTIANLDLTLPFSVAVKKNDASANTVTINRGGTDVINAVATSKVITANGVGAVFVPDLTNSPDDWTALDIGTAADGSITKVKLATGAKDLTVQSKTANYTILNTDEIVFVDATSGALTMTLPTAVGISGRSIYIKKTDSSTNAVTLDGDGSETIDGALTRKLASQNEAVRIVSNGTSWQVVERFIPSQWSAYTPTFTGFGTVVTQDFQWRRIGSNVEIRGKWTSATVTSTEARVSLPNSYTSHANPTTITVAGTLLFGVNGASSYYVLIEPSVAYVTFGRQSGTSNAFTKENAATDFSNTSLFSMVASIPVTQLDF